MATIPNMAQCRTKYDDDDGGGGGGRGALLS